MNAKKILTLPAVPIGGNHLVRRASATAAETRLNVTVDGRAVDPERLHRQAVVSGGAGSVAVRLTADGELLVVVSGNGQSASLAVSTKGEISEPVVQRQRRAVKLCPPGALENFV